jgi:hypothetical protein
LNTEMVCSISSGLYCAIPAHQTKRPRRGWPDRAPAGSDSASLRKLRQSASGLDDLLVSRRENLWRKATFYGANYFFIIFQGISGSLRKEQQNDILR